MKKGLLVLSLLISTSFVSYANSDNDYKCDKDNPKACFNFGTVRLLGMMGVKKDVHGAIDFFQQGCEFKGGDSCGMLGYIYQSGKGGIKKDEQKALSYYHQGCTLLDAQSCLNEGLLNIRNIKNDEDALLKAQKAFSSGCELKLAKACTQNGILSFENKNFEEANALFKKGCDLKDGLGCARYGDSFLKDQNTLEKALSFYKRSCDLNNAEGCRKASLYATGSLKLDYASRSCQGGDMEGCRLEGEALLALGNDDSIKQAVDLFKKSCGIHSKRACFDLAELYEKGIGVKPSLQDSLDNYMRGCVYGDKESCVKAQAISEQIENKK